MSKLQDLRDAEADRLTAEGYAILEAEGKTFLTYERAASLWEQAYDVRRGHADEPEWYEDEEN